MRFSIPLLNCLRCNSEIPEIDRSHSRKYCKECAIITHKENQLNHMRKRNGITEKKCYTCGKLTYRKKTCSKECCLKAVRIDNLLRVIEKRKRLIATSRKRIKELRNA